MGLVQMSMCGGVMVLVVAILRAALFKWMPKRVFPLLWMVVLLRLLLPFDVSSPFSAYSLPGSMGEAWHWQKGLEELADSISVQKGQESKKVQKGGAGGDCSPALAVGEFCGACCLAAFCLQAAAGLTADCHGEYNREADELQNTNGW